MTSHAKAKESGTPIEVCEALEDKYNDKRIQNEYDSGIVRGIQLCVQAISELPADSGAALLSAAEELLACKEMKDRYESMAGSVGNPSPDYWTVVKSYNDRAPLAWSNLKAAIEAVKS